MTVVNEKPAQPLADTSHREHANRSSSQWSPWLGSRPRDATRSAAPTQPTPDIDR